MVLEVIIFDWGIRELRMAAASRPHDSSKAIVQN